MCVCVRVYVCVCARVCVCVTLKTLKGPFPWNSNTSPLMLVLPNIDHRRSVYCAVVVHNAVFVSPTLALLTVLASYMVFWTQHEMQLFPFLVTFTSFIELCEIRRQLEHPKVFCFFLVWSSYKKQEKGIKCIFLFYFLFFLLRNIWWTKVTPEP